MKPIKILVILISFQYIKICRCYEFQSSGFIDLNEDNGWSELASTCVGVMPYMESSNLTKYPDPSGFVHTELRIANSSYISFKETNISYTLVFYDDQENSYPRVNNTPLSCHEKVEGHYARYRLSLQLSTDIIFNNTVRIYQHITTRYWYFYLSSCNQSVIYPRIAYEIHYWDGNDTEICTEPPMIEASNDSGDSGIANSTYAAYYLTSDIVTDSGPTATTRRSIHIHHNIGIIIIGIMIIAVIGLLIGFKIYFNKKHPKTPQPLLMESLNDDIGTHDPCNLLRKWSLEQYAQLLIEEKGYDDIEQWIDLSVGQLQTMGFKEGHSRKFMKRVKEHFVDVVCEKEGSRNVLVMEDDAYEGEGYTINN